VQDLLLCAKHLFVGAMVAWVHPGSATNGKSDVAAMVAGFMRGSREPAKSEHFGAEFSGAAKAKTPPPSPARFCPL
jgi:hypothetical protein